jgi:hypothetical protein
LLNQAALGVGVNGTARNAVDRGHHQVGQLRSYLGHDTLLDLSGGRLSLRLDLLLALVGAGLRVCQDAFGLLVGSCADLLRFTPRLREQRLSIRLSLFGCASRLVGLFHALADALGARIEHAHNRFE